MTKTQVLQLLTHADFARHIRPNALRRSQLPDPTLGTTIGKPRRWSVVQGGAALYCSGPA